MQNNYKVSGELLDILCIWAFKNQSFNVQAMLNQNQMQIMM